MWAAPPDETERAKVVEAWLKSMRAGVGLDEPDYLLSPQHPVCIGLKVPAKWSADKRRSTVRQKLIELIDHLEDERQREAARVAYRLHPNYQVAKNTNRRKAYAKDVGWDFRTVERDENKAIGELARVIGKGPKPLFPGRRFRVAPSGVLIPVWFIRFIKIYLTFGALGIGILAAAYVGARFGWFYIIKAP